MTRSDSPAESKNPSRRQFLSHSSAALSAAAVAATWPLVNEACAAEEAEIKIGLIGCGGRGTGAAVNALGAATKVIYPQSGYHTENVKEGSRIAHRNITIHAMADLFPDRLDSSRGELKKLGIDVPRSRCFVGFDAYKDLLSVPEVNYVILATPPHFRPIHLMAAIEAGKNAFIEKPAAVDVPGVRMVMEAGQLATRKGLGIAAGTQRRHQKSYQETIARIQDGAIGDIVYGKCYWNGGQIWVVDRKPGWSDIEWQMRNWNYFTWLSGDHIVEQHVHNLDIMNWVIGSHPTRAVSGLGGRQVRTGERHGYIFDHFAVEFEYPNGVSVFSQCRQINNCRGRVEEMVVGTRGKSNCKSSIAPYDGDRWRFRGTSPNPYEQEHMDLIASVQAGKPINEAQNVAESTLTGIIGREATYSGQEITWDEALKSTTHIGPETYAFGPFPTPKVALPGFYKFS